MSRPLKDRRVTIASRVMTLPLDGDARIGGVMARYRRPFTVAVLLLAASLGLFLVGTVAMAAGGSNPLVGILGTLLAASALVVALLLRGTISN